MTKFVVSICGVILLVTSGFTAYNPFIDGATVEFDVAVVDDEGKGVADAEVRILFAGAKEQTNITTALSDTNGCVHVKNESIGYATFIVNKDGYYETEQRIALRTQPGFSEERTTQSRKWDVQPIPVRLVLKKVRNPVRIVRNGERYSGLNYPATNVVMGLDLEMREWCPPFGKGKHDDLQVCYDFWRDSKDRFKVYSFCKITMTNAVDGFYWCKVDGFSEMKHLYHADTNAVYQKELELVYDRRSGKVEREVNYPQDQYLVFRTRTKLDEAGRLISAHYGFIPEKAEYGIKFDFPTRFNPVENDTNLEDAAVIEQHNRFKRRTERRR